MHLNEYQRAAAKTAVFPNDKSLEYTALGLNGEAGEVAEVVKKMLRGDEFQEPPSMLLEKELGDVLWYLAMCAAVAGITLEEVALVNIEKLRSRQERQKLKGSGDNR